MLPMEATGIQRRSPASEIAKATFGESAASATAAARVARDGGGTVPSTGGAATELWWLHCERSEASEARKMDGFVASLRNDDGEQKDDRLLPALRPVELALPALVLMALEVAAPECSCSGSAFAALLSGCCRSAFMSWQAELIAFAVLSIAAVPVWRRLARAKSSSPETDFLNRRSDALVGRVFTLEKPIQDGIGTVRVDDTIWRVAGPDAPAGSRVRVVHADGASLTVAGA